MTEDNKIRLFGQHFSENSSCTHRNAVFGMYKFQIQKPCFKIWSLHGKVVN